jgi:hypothetical protein
MMPRELEFQGVLFPTLLIIFIGAALVFWIIDGVLANRGLYGYVWHPALFRLSMFVVLFGVCGLFVYR